MSHEKIKQRFETARRLALANRAPAGCPELIDAVQGSTPNAVSEFFIGWPGTLQESPLFRCPGRNKPVCNGCPLRTDPNDPTHFQRV